LEIDFPVQIRSIIQMVLSWILASLGLAGTSSHFRLSSRFSGALADTYPSRIVADVHASFRTLVRCSLLFHRKLISKRVSKHIISRAR
jgi:hypothetical protein